MLAVPLYGVAYPEFPHTTHKIVWGDDEFHLNHRLAYVRAEDMDIVDDSKHKHHYKR